MNFQCIFRYTAIKQIAFHLLEALFVHDSVTCSHRNSNSRPVDQESAALIRLKLQEMACCTYYLVDLTRVRYTPRHLTCSKALPVSKAFYSLGQAL